MDNPGRLDARAMLLIGKFPFWNNVPLVCSHAKCACQYLESGEIKLGHNPWTSYLNDPVGILVLGWNIIINICNFVSFVC